MTDSGWQDVGLKNPRSYYLEMKRTHFLIIRSISIEEPSETAPKPWKTRELRLTGLFYKW